MAIPVAVTDGDHVHPFAWLGNFETLDGTASFDPDGDPITDWLWTIVDAPTGSAAALVGAATATPTLTPDLRGTYRVFLQVKAGGDWSESDMNAAASSAFSEVVVTTQYLALREPASGTRSWKNWVNAALDALDSAYATLLGHVSRHRPGGGDPLPTAAPAQVLSSQTAVSDGVSTSVSRADHAHTFYMLRGYQGVGAGKLGLPAKDGRMAYSLSDRRWMVDSGAAWVPYGTVHDRVVGTRETDVHAPDAVEHELNPAGAGGVWTPLYDTYVPGSIMRLRCSGEVGANPGFLDLTIRVRADSGELLIERTLLNPAAGHQWMIDAEAIVITVGAPGTARCRLLMFGPATPGYCVTDFSPVDNTLSMYLSVTVQWSGADAGSRVHLLTYVQSHDLPGLTLL